METDINAHRNYLSNEKKNWKKLLYLFLLFLVVCLVEVGRYIIN